MGDIRPEHYKETSLECRDAIKMVAGDKGLTYFYLGNVIKYLWRDKEPYEDALKAQTYYYMLSEDERWMGVITEETFLALQELIDVKMNRAKKK